MKLKPIPTNTVVHTPTEEEAKELLDILHENGYDYNLNYELAVEINTRYGYPSTMCFIFREPCRIDHSSRSYFEKLGHTILTLAEFKEMYLLNEDNVIKSLDLELTVDIMNKGAYECIKAINNMGTKDYPPYLDRPKMVVETPGKELNLCELLRGHEGEEIFLTTMGTVIVDGISEENIRFKLHKTTRDTYLLPSNGKMRNSGMIIAFPSYTLYEKYPLDAYTAWMEWNKEQKTYPLRFVCRKGDDEAITEFDEVLFRTSTDRDKCIEEIKAIIERYSKQQPWAAFKTQYKS